MSDHETVYEMQRDDTRYSTPVPELDDHRNQAASVQRTQRSRRGTIDTLYGTQAADPSAPELNRVNDALIRTSVCDSESVDDEDDDKSTRSRRPTISISETRGISPPNSVKAFAIARRRERDSALLPAPYNLLADGRDDVSLKRTVSRASKISEPSPAKDDADSIHSSAAEDVCFPHSPPDNRRDKRKLYIDFDVLEKFITEEGHDHTPPKNQPKPRSIFKDCRARHSASEKAPDADEIAMEEKVEEKLGITPTPTEHADGNRFSFFSSAWESTIHAAELGDLIMPGEDIRNLFYLPEDASDGVWWLNMNNPTEEEIRAICKAFHIHPLTMEDIEKQETREKIELFPAYYFACFRSFNIVPNEDCDDGIKPEPFNVYVIVFREGTLSFSFAPNRHVGMVRKRITALKDYVSLSSDWICYAIM